MKASPDARRDAGFSIFYMGINLGAFDRPDRRRGHARRKDQLAAGFRAPAVSRRCSARSISSFRSATSATPGCRRQVCPAARRASARGRCSSRSPAAAAASSRSCCSRASIRRSKHSSRSVCSSARSRSQSRSSATPVLRRSRLRRTQACRRHHRVLLLRRALLGRLRATGHDVQHLRVRDTRTARSLGSWFEDGQHPAPGTSPINPWFIILFAPVFAWFWVCARRAQPGSFGADQDGRRPAAPGRRLPGHDLRGQVRGFAPAARSGPVWLILAYLFHTFGELCLSPVGLSNVTKLAPQKFVGRMMGTWFLGTAIGNTIAGLAGGQFAEAKVDGHAGHLPGDDADRRRRRRSHPPHIARACAAGSETGNEHARLTCAAIAAIATSPPPPAARWLELRHHAADKGTDAAEPAKNRSCRRRLRQTGQHGSRRPQPRSRTPRAGRSPPTSPSTRNYLNSRAPPSAYLEFFSRKAGEAKAYDDDKPDPSTARIADAIKLGVSAPAPADAAKRNELATLSTELDAMYGEGKYCPRATEQGRQERRRLQESR